MVFGALAASPRAMMRSISSSGWNASRVFPTAVECIGARVPTLEPMRGACLLSCVMMYRTESWSRMARCTVSPVFSMSVLRNGLASKADTQTKS